MRHKEDSDVRKTTSERKNTMDMGKYMYLAVIGLASMTLISGCSGYGSISYQPSYVKGAVTIEELVENSDEYNVYYSGYAVNNPSGIMFDPKNDSKTLVPTDRWIKIEGEETVSEVVSWIKIHNYPWYHAGLYKIIGPDQEFYGYLFTGWHHLTTKAINEGELLVYDLPAPPQYYGPSAEIEDD